MPFASDDFVTTGWCNAAFRILAAAALGIVVLVHAFQPAGDGSGDCSIEIDVLLFVAFALVLMGVVVDMALAYASGRGSMPQEHKRRMVPTLFVLHLLTVVGNTIVAAAGLYFVFSVPAEECEDVLNQDNPRWVLLQVFCWVTALEVIAEYCVMTPLAVLAATGRPDARVPDGDLGDAELQAKAQAWSRRCNLCTGCLCGRSAFSKEGFEGGVGGLDTAQTLAMVGHVMASTLAPVQSQKLTLSDIVGGMLLLRSVQKHIEATGALKDLLARVSGGSPASQQVQVQVQHVAAPVASPQEALSAPAPTPPGSTGARAPAIPGSKHAPPCGAILALAREVLPRSTPLRQFPSAPPAHASPGWGGKPWCDVQVMAVAAHYSVFMCAAYGWQLYTFEHTAAGCCALAGEQMHSCCCRERGGATGVPCSAPCTCCCCCCKSKCCVREEVRVRGDCSGLHKPAVTLQMQQLKWSPLVRTDIPAAIKGRVDALKSQATINSMRPQQWGAAASSPWTLLFANWESRWLVPSFLVMYDSTCNALVLVVRGTLSIEDCITDAAAVPFAVGNTPTAIAFHRWLNSQQQICPEFPSAEGSRKPTQHTSQPPQSPSDCSVPKWACDKSKWYAHEGMWRAAEAVVDSALQAGIFQSVPEKHKQDQSSSQGRQRSHIQLSFGPRIPPSIVDALCGVHGTDSPPAPNSQQSADAKAGSAEQMPHSPRVMVIGHSLGAATASLLGMMLKPSFTETQVVAFSPPLALVSPSLSIALRPCLTSVTLGKDIVARMTVGTMRRMFTLVGELLPLAAVSKHKLIRSNAFAGLRSAASRHCGFSWCAPEDDDELVQEGTQEGVPGQRRFMAISPPSAALAADGGHGSPGGGRAEWTGSSRRLKGPSSTGAPDSNRPGAAKYVRNPHAQVGDEVEGATVCGCATHATSVQSLFGSNWRSARALALQLAEKIFAAEAVQGADGLPVDPAQVATLEDADTGGGGAAAQPPRSAAGESADQAQHEAEATSTPTTDVLGMELWMPGRTVHLVPVTPYHEEGGGGAAASVGLHGAQDPTCSCSRGEHDGCRTPLVSAAKHGDGAYTEAAARSTPGGSGGACRSAVPTAYAGMWCDQRDFTWSGIQVSSRMVRDHLPDRVRNAVLRAWDSTADGAPARAEQV